MDGDLDGGNVRQVNEVRIVPRHPQPYIAAMREALAKLLLIAAILLMPFGMAAPAAAAEHHAPAASSAMSHCPEEGTAEQRHGGGECTMACASTLPAIDQPRGQLPAAVAAPSLRVVAAPLTGLHPETATPPPRPA